ncbi:COMMD1 [Cervus elaphus hippelaphus]|uniref:COMMD1 n=1 Tax=Cervus elaphus hippelaphus TaxID=46360 RepID=A0A212CXV9_CEREH|nr:COMMD1 [Cervus elaphus hippelaphus]
MAAELEGSKSLSGLLSGLAQDTFYGHPGITEELLRSQLYPEVSPEEFRPFLAKMKGILKSVASADMDFNQLEAFLTAQTKKQGGITPEQAAVISKFWKSHKTKIRESLMNQSRWDSLPLGGVQGDDLPALALSNQRNLSIRSRRVYLGPSHLCQ